MSKYSILIRKARELLDKNDIPRDVMFDMVEQLTDALEDVTKPSPQKVMKYINPEDDGC